MKPSGPRLLFAGRFLIIVSISVLVMGLLRFSISSWSSLESYTFLRICPFLPCCPFYWHIIVDSSLLWSFVFLCFLLCYSLELCIQRGIAFLSSFAFCISSFHSCLEGLFRQPFSLFAFLFLGDGLDPCLLYNIMNPFLPNSDLNWRK